MTTAIHVEPTGLREPEYREHHVEIVGFADGEIEDQSKLSGTITGMMAICIKGDRFVTIPVVQLRVKP